MITRSSISLLLLPFLFFGCKSTPTPVFTVPADTTPVITYPARPTISPTPFKIFHHANSTFTLVVPEATADDQLSSVLWTLRDAAHTHTFDSLHIPQKQVDTDGRTIWFHIYRGTKCAPEKYAVGHPPCGDSYHAAADYTLDPQKNPLWDKGTILHGEDKQSDLWNPDAPYAPPPSP